MFQKIVFSHLVHKAFRKAGQPKQAMKLLHQLLNSAIEEQRFHETAKHYWLLASECLKMGDNVFFYV